MPTLTTVTNELERIAPLRLAADWDAVGLLVGTRRESVGRIMTCLTLTPEVVREAVQESADLVVVHHPLPFRPVGRLTDASPVGAMLLDLVAAGIGVWSSHTAWDSAAGGVNEQLAAMLGLGEIAPVVPDRDDPRVGFGRLGQAAAGMNVAMLAERLAASVGAAGAQVAGDANRPAGRVGIVCGSGGESIAIVRSVGCDTLVTGEIRLHAAVEALARGLAVVAVGHHPSERFSMESLAERLVESLPGLVAWASHQERDPLSWRSASSAAAAQ
jgi:dinuclear metal center YbgI/SA1388 family protein